MNKLVFFVEEPSMADLLDGLIPRLFPSLIGEFQCIPHRGKNDLVKNVSGKIRAWREPNVRFVIVQDQNRSDCREVKAKLSDLCRQAGRSDTLVRIVCRELEAWYIGEPCALAKAFPSHTKEILKELGKRRYRNPDTVHQPSKVIAGLVPEFQKRSGAQRVAEHLSLDNKSRSFQAFIEGIERLQPSPRS